MIAFSYSKSIHILFTAFLFLCLLKLTHSQEENYLNSVIERINDLEKDLKNVENNKFNSSKENGSNFTNAVASHEQRILEIEEEIRTLNGNLEELQYEIKNISQMLKKINIYGNDNKNNDENDLTFTKQSPSFEENTTTIIEDPNVVKNPSMKILGTISEKPNGNNEETISSNVENLKSLPQETINQNTITDDKMSLLLRNPSEIYSYAYDMLVAENFIEAEKSFKAFIGEHPNDPLTSNAYYWLGETYYVQKKYQLASISFARGYQNFPKGNKALDQLFKLALTFMNLGKNEDACAAFSKLDSEFPDAPKRLSNRAKEYIKRAKC